jgi:hypothetical protein
MCGSCARFLHPPPPPPLSHTLQTRLHPPPHSHRSLLSHAGSDLDVTLLLESPLDTLSIDDHEKLLKGFGKGLTKRSRAAVAMRAQCDAPAILLLLPPCCFVPFSCVSLQVYQIPGPNCARDQGASRVRYCPQQNRQHSQSISV